jgi:hypothetical protein
MSNPQAIAAVSATLQSLLLQGVTTDPDLADTTVTTLPLDKARDSNNANQLNLFLYQTLPNAAWRNQDMPRQSLPGETSMSPLALRLYYLLTSFGRGNDAAQPFTHHLLGKAMSILYDHSVLLPADIKAATAVSLPNSDLDRQVERVRITLQPLSVDEISKLWTGFQTQYRLSVAYEATVVLIESKQSAKTPLPVLTRGQGDSGISSQADLVPPFPTLEEINLPNQQTSARLNDIVTLKGHDLGGNSVIARFTTARLPSNLDVPVLPGATDKQIQVRIPNFPSTWPAGFYTIAAVIQRAGQADRLTNEAPLSLAPRITNITPNPAVHGDITYTVTCSPQVLPEQRASLLLGDVEILAEPHPAHTTTLTFQAKAVPGGNHFVRLRIDGVDTLLVDRTVKPPVFDVTQKVTVT